MIMPKRRPSGLPAKPRAVSAGRLVLSLLLGGGLLGAASAPASAHQRYRTAAYEDSRGSAQYGGPVSEWILVDADTGQVIGEHNADALTYPASLTKMMTLYLTFEALNQGRITLDQRFPVSEHAATRAPSRLGLTPGDSVSVRNLILAVVTKSANDAATVLAEGLAGSEANFARYMTWKARQLGMMHSWYDNASGLPDAGQITTARDIARLALALYRNFPREYRYFATRAFNFRGEIVHGHDHLLDWYPGADGIKTGFTNASGFNLASSAMRNGHRLIGVVMGGRTWRSRDLEMASLLDQGFAAIARGATPQPNAPVLVAAAAPRQTVPAVAAAAPAPRPAAPRPIPAPASMPAAPVVARAAAPPRTEPAALAARSGFISHVASNALRHLEPVGHAEAAPLRHEAVATSEDWAIQLGAFRDEAAAASVAHRAGRLSIARGKPSQILPTGRRHARLYRARLLHFTSKAARAACAELRRHKIACSVVPAESVRVASR